MPNLYAVDQYKKELLYDFADDDYYIWVDENPDKLPTYVIVGLDEDEDTATIFSAYDLSEEYKVGVKFARRLKYVQNRYHVGNIQCSLPAGSSVKSIIAEELINQYSQGVMAESWFDLTSEANIDIDISNKKKNKVILDTNTEITFSNVGNHDSFILRIEQDGTGSRTVSWDAGMTIEWLSDSELKSGAEEITIYGFIKYANNCYYGIKIGETQ